MEGAGKGAGQVGEGEARPQKRGNTSFQIKASVNFGQIDRSKSK